MLISRSVTILALSSICLGMAALVSPVAAQTVATPGAISPTVVGTVSSAVTYVVQPGDDLFRIGLKFGLSYTVLAEANGIVNPNLILIGQTLTIPGGATMVTGTPAPSETAPSTITPSATSALPLLGNPDTPATYTVQKGDLLYLLATQFHTSVYILAQLNNLGNSNLIYVGEVLKLPVSGVTGSAPIASATPTVTSFVILYPTVTPAPATDMPTVPAVLPIATDVPATVATQPATAQAG